MNRSSILRLVLAFISLGGFHFLNRANADESSIPSVPHVTVYGTATVEATPDQLRWYLTVKSVKPELSQTATSHSDAVKRVLELLNAHQVPLETTQTSDMEFGKNYVERDRSRFHDGYFASSVVKFTISDLSKYQALWKGLSEIDEVSVSDVEYQSSERIEHQHKARVRALRAAKEKARELAEVLGSTLAEPLVIEEERFVDSPWSNNVSFESSREAPGENLAPGRIPIRSRVKVAFRLITAPN